MNTGGVLTKICIIVPLKPVPTESEESRWGQVEFARAGISDFQRSTVRGNSEAGIVVIINKR